jgi:F0F1-type ATP synthase membrane subunit b/b'
VSVSKKALEQREKEVNERLLEAKKMKKEQDAVKNKQMMDKLKKAKKEVDVVRRSFIDGL